MKIESYFNCSSLLRREAGREGVQRAGEGFTLAEVLIALTVIGVISAITVPVLMNNTQKHEAVTALKKAYSTLSQVTNQIIAEEGSPKQNEKGESWLKDSDALYEMYKKYLNNAKECGSASGCFASGTKYKTLAGTSSWNFASSYKKLILADGIYVMFADAAKSCTAGDWNGNSNRCAQILVDLNGGKQPNQAGKDLFAFILRENGLYPEGCGANTIKTNCKNLNGGLGCTCRVFREGAINY